MGREPQKEAAAIEIDPRARLVHFWFKQCCCQGPTGGAGVLEAWFPGWGFLALEACGSWVMSICSAASCAWLRLSRGI